MDKIKDMMHGGHKKEGEQTHQTTTTTTGTGAGYGEPGYGQTTATHTEGTGEKKHGLFGVGGHKKVCAVATWAVILTCMLFCNSLSTVLTHV